MAVSQQLRIRKQIVLNKYNNKYTCNLDSARNMIVQAYDINTTQKENNNVGLYDSRVN